MAHGIILTSLTHTSNLRYIPQTMVHPSNRGTAPQNQPVWDFTPKFCFNSVFISFSPSENGDILDFASVNMFPNKQ